jgi:hypothetical protein
MARNETRKCPACGKTKSFRVDCKTCGCAGTNPFAKEAKVMSDPIDAIKKALKAGPKSVESLAALTGKKATETKKLLKELIKSGAMIQELPDGSYGAYTAELLDPGKDTHDHYDRGDGWNVFGWTSDNHLCNKHSRLDVLEQAYDRFAAEGVKVVLNGGNWIDGEARFNKRELIVAPGMDNQINYLVENWPSKPGVVTKFVAGDDHEGWYAQREGIDIGQYLQTKAESAGRDDLKYLGYGEADISLNIKGSHAVLRLMHGGGGSSYALSYSSQKIVESFQGGEKPAILMVGHYHKFDWCYPREVNVVQLGCTTDQSLFMRKNKIQAHVGFGIVKFQQNPKDGSVTRFAVEWFPYFDRKYYETRY